MIDFIIHSNDTNWGHVWHIVTTDGKGMSTLTSSEIAIATAKGWTVTFQKS